MPLGISPSLTIVCITYSYQKTTAILIFLIDIVKYM
jgi:hypothetical protein